MTAGIDPVLLTGPPRFSPSEAVELARRTFGVVASGAENLGSERDQTFMLLAPIRPGSVGPSTAGPAGVMPAGVMPVGVMPVGVIKVSNPAESTAMLDMEALVAWHIARVDPTLPIALPRRRPGGGDGVQDHRVSIEGRPGTDEVHWVRMYDVMPGRGRSDPLGFDDDALIAWGTTAARLTRATGGFFHPAAARLLPWDVQHAAAVHPMVGLIGNPRWRTAVAGALDRYDEVVAPAWGRLRAQVVHGDLSTDNVLVDERGRVSGIVDFGDMSHSAAVVDLVAALDSVGTGREGDELLRLGRLVIDGYERLTPLDPGERAILGELWAARAAVGVAIAAWRVDQGLEGSAFAERYSPTAVLMIETLASNGWRLDPPRRPHPVGRLVERRRAVLGPGLEPLSYDDPVEVVSASGVWLTDSTGRRLLDMYNNVPCVGHAHPRVTEAIARQGRVLNTNLRYLHGAAVELAERLVGYCPAGLDTVVFVNSGSEANDLAWRMATAVSGQRGGLCTSFAYHGVTEAIAALSPETWPAGHRPAHVERWAPPDPRRGRHLGPDGFVAAIDRLVGRGLGLAAAILDGVLQSDGVLDPPADYVRELVELTHAAGGCWIADEVQGGHGRTGLGMWSFERFGITPDFITLGKPMGNGHPVAALITRRDVAERFGAAQGSFFSTFGGNQVSIAAAAAVLDVLDDEGVIARVHRVGEQLRAASRAATADDDRVGDVRGVGLANGIEIVTDRLSATPDPGLAAAIKNALRRHGVLVGTTGPQGNVLKIRPPLAFRSEHVEPFLDAWGRARADTARSSV